MRKPSRRCLFCIILGLLAGFTGLNCYADNGARFFSVIEDLPLMPGLSEDKDAAITFESVNGRIAEALAYSNSKVGGEGVFSADTVREFYGASLPQLGWRLLSGHTFHRAGETLELLISSERGVGVAVRFALRPQKFN